MVKFTWKPSVMDMHNIPVNFCFDIIEGSSPLIIGIDIKQHVDTCKIVRPRTFMFKIPTDIHVSTFHTIEAQDKNGNERSRRQSVPHARSPLSTLMSSNNKKELQMEIFHSFGHEREKGMQILTIPAGYDEEKAISACMKFQCACPICE